MLSCGDLKKYSVFSELSEDECSVLLPLLSEQKYNAGAIIYSAGEVSEELYLVASGEVIITHRLDHETVTLARLLPGYFFGESGLVELNHRHRTYAQAVTDTAVIKLTRASFSKLENSHPRVAFVILNKIARVLSERLTDNTARIGIISSISRLINDPAKNKNLNTLAKEVIAITLQAIPCHQAFLGVYLKHNPDHLRILALQSLSPKELPAELPTDTDPYLNELHRHDNEILIHSESYSQGQKVFYAKKNLLGRAIKIEDNNVGVIVLADKESGEFTIQNSLVLQIIAGQISFALEESYEQEKKRAGEELEREYIGL